MSVSMHTMAKWLELMVVYIVSMRKIISRAQKYRMASNHHTVHNTVHRLITDATHAANPSQSESTR